MHSLDDRLNDSAPDLGPADPRLTAELEDLVARTRDAARTSTRTARARDRRARRTIVAASAATVVLLGGGAAAASSFGGWTAPWAAEPAETVVFTLPSGGVCEQRIGDLDVANPAAEKMIHAWLAEHTLGEIADIDGTIDAIRAEGPQTHRSVGTGRPDVVHGYGTANYDADHEYSYAVWRALTEAVTAKLWDEGYTDYEDYQYSWTSEMHCSGSNPHPDRPDFLK